MDPRTRNVRSWDEVLLSKPGPSIFKFQGSNRKWTVLKSQKERFSEMSRSDSESERLVKMAGLNGPYSLNDQLQFNVRKSRKKILESFQNATEFFQKDFGRENIQITFS